MQARHSPFQASDSVIPHDVNQDHEIVLREALVATQTQAKKKEYQLGLRPQITQAQDKGVRETS